MPAAQVFAVAFAVALAVPKTKAGAPHLVFEMWETTKARESLLLQLFLLLPLLLLFCLSFPQGNLLLSFPKRIEHRHRTMQNTPEKAQKNAILAPQFHA